jgi:hypothetical protein
MKLLKITLGYLKWHYFNAVLTTFTFWTNILVFLFNFFSIKTLACNFFTPWKRLADNYPKNFNIKAYFSVFIVNFFMRLVGIFFRSIILFIGLSVCAIYIMTLPITIVVWLALPPALIYMAIQGLILIIFS